jgi:beta-lactamase regulating signal transducer with metallopeptidase domain
MPQYTDPESLNGNTIAAILGGISLVLTAIGIPKILENWKAIREMKYSKIVAKLEENQSELSEVKKELYQTRDQLKKVSNIVSVVIPMMKLKNQNDNETLELIRIFERESGIHVTPSPNEEKE